ncbi:hypothetical protein BIW11_08825, partial [Tropilaelaps mercedesae]
FVRFRYHYSLGTFVKVISNLLILTQKLIIAVLSQFLSSLFIASRIVLPILRKILSLLSIIVATQADGKLDPDSNNRAAWSLQQVELVPHRECTIPEIAPVSVSPGADTRCNFETMPPPVSSPLMGLQAWSVLGPDGRFRFPVLTSRLKGPGTRSRAAV